ncbi:MAG TPA: nuclear transport factor 2 family protein [Candidatus Binataceae bacterium]
MKRSILWLAVLGAVAAVIASRVEVNAKASDEAAIKALEERYAKAIRAKDADAIMANYLPGDELVVFDVIPPRQYNGFDAFKKDWQGVIGSVAGPMQFDLSDLSIMAGPEYAFSHSIQRFRWTDAKGNKVDMTTRVTDCYKKINGKWMIVHEHISVPVELTTGKADMNSKP